MSFPLYISIFLPLIRYSSHNPYVHPPSYLSTNTYPNQQSNLVIQNISLIFLLLRCEDVKLNLGPCSHIVPNLPPYYKACSSIYFIPNTIKFKSKYQHLAQNFVPHLLRTYPLHLQKALSHPHLFTSYKHILLTPPHDYFISLLSL
jgi:hypothetical protein